MLTRYYKDTNTVEEAIELLRDNRLGSVPVHDAAGKWLGYVGAIDLLAGIVKTIKDGKLPTVLNLFVSAWVTVHVSPNAGDGYRGRGIQGLLH